ncbi:MAG: hypothetical protein VSS75_004980 [Candidatus Parabeggiatoa sp.]|nr:hypothetical protein [Candidatus Parabeggiatoa sp.]
MKLLISLFIFTYPLMAQANVNEIDLNKEFPHLLCSIYNRLVPTLANAASKESFSNDFYKRIAVGAWLTVFAMDTYNEGYFSYHFRNVICTDVQCSIRSWESCTDDTSVPGERFYVVFSKKTFDEILPTKEGLREFAINVVTSQLPQTNIGCKAMYDLLKPYKVDLD